MAGRFTLLAVAVMVAVAGTPDSLLAQATPAPRGPISSTLNGFSYYGNWLIAGFDSIPAGRYDFRPTPVQQSVGYIAQHLEDANYQLCGIFGSAQRKVTAADSLADTVKARWPKDTLVRRLKESLMYCGRAMAELTDEKLAEEITVGVRRAPRTRWVILFLTDLAEHYAQLASYMRLLGMIPPSAR